MKILRITDMKIRGHHDLWLSFNNGFKGEVNLTPLMNGPIFVPLQDPEYFAQVELNSECGTITWPNGADLAPEALYDLAQKPAEPQDDVCTQGILFPECFSDEEKKKLSGHPRHLRFVVQLHHASRLHYDFRLELSGVLISWVLLEGPSLRVGQWREAIRVNDHGMFSLKPEAERLILPGNYGAGPILTWDIGDFSMRGVVGRKLTTAAMQTGLEKGTLRLILKGKKLKGAFTLFRDQTWKPEKWILSKEQDKFTTDEDITLQNNSVLTGRTLDQVAANVSAPRRT